LDSSLATVRVVAASPAFAALGRCPAISDDGSVIAFYGDLTSQGASALNALHESYGYEVSGLPRQFLRTEPLTPGPGIFIEMMTVNGPLIQRAADVGDGGDRPILSFQPDSRLGVTQFQTSGRVCSVMVPANFNGGTALYLSRTFMRYTADDLIGLPFNPSKPLLMGGRTWGSSSVEISRTGQTIAGLGVVSSLDVFVSISERGYVGFWGGAGATTGACRSQPRAWLRKYKQGNSMWNADDPSGGRLRIPDGDPNVKMSSGGCIMACLAMMAGQFGVDFTPLQMRDWLNENGYVDANGDLSYPTLRFRHPLVPEEIKTTLVYAGRGNGWSDLVAELRAGRLVMLGVPSRSSTGTSMDNRMHRIVAYGLSPDLDPGANPTPSDVLVADPGRTYFPSDASETFVDVSLAQFFQDLNQHYAASGRNGLTVDPFSWVNEGTYQDNRGSHTLNARRLKQRIERFDNIPRVLPPRAMVSVNSPVELVLTDVATGQRYATDPSLLAEGDVLLETLGGLRPAKWQDEPDPDAEESFPPFSVVLPDHLSGVRLVVELHGVGDGPYSISYITGDPAVAAPASLTGTILAGQVLFGEFAPGGSICAADFNRDGFLDFFDYSDYVGCFEIEECPAGATADFNRDGFVDFFDYLDFVSAFETGC
jgi:hypothetical protein